MENATFVAQYLQDALGSFRAYRKLAEKAIDQLHDDELFVTLDQESNSIAVIMKHMAGNMISCWTNFLISDGEKPDRNRDMEFVIESNTTKEDVIKFWERGWETVFAAVEPLTADDFNKTVSIRGETHTIVQAINRQMTHYAYHIGQIVFIAKHMRSAEWKSLSIPRNKSQQFNAYFPLRHTSDKEKQFDAVADTAADPDNK
jgi:hypothetical protein